MLFIVIDACFSAAPVNMSAPVRRTVRNWAHAIFEEYFTLSQKRYEIGTELWMANMHSIKCQMLLFSVTLNDRLL